MFNVLLFEPEIPPNTGNAIRLCANTGAALHLLGPLGFELDEPRLRRAGLDYHEMARVKRHPDLASCLADIGATRLFVIETGGPRRYADAAFGPGDSFLFGPESRGLPAELLCRPATGQRAPEHPDAPWQPQPQPLQFRRGRGLRGLAAEWLCI